MSGAGIQSAGTTPAGFGTSADAQEFGGAFLRNTRNGTSFAARKIDPRTRDYVIDANGRQLGMNQIKQAVQISVQTERGSSVVQDLGHRLATLDRITPNFERRILSILTEAVKPLVDQGLIEVIGFRGFATGNARNGLQRGAVYGRFLWKDLTTSQEHEELI